MIISEFKEEHIPPIIEMCNNVFGENYIQSNYFIDYLNLERKHCFVYLNEGVVIGFITYEIFNQNNFLQEILKDKDFFNTIINESKELIIIKQVVIASDYRRQGLASSLLKRALENLKSKNNIVFCFAWKKNENTALKSILQYATFQLIKTINDYWKEDSLTHQYSCAFCGSPPCSCSADVYIKKMPSIA